MRVRHRVPTIFNLSMVDVLCCALGCVILLWLLNLQQAKERAVQAGQTNERLKATEHSLAQTAAGLASAQGERDQARKDLTAARTRLADLDRELADLRTQRRQAEERLALLTRDRQTLTRDKAELGRQLLALDARLRDRAGQVQQATRRTEELTGTLRDAEARVRQLQAQADLVPGLRADLERSRSQLAAADTRSQQLARQAGEQQRRLAAADDRLAGLRRENRSLAEQARRIRAAAEERFEGIALTGRRVLFLVDMSGSMDLVDERTADPAKWRGVRDSVARLMRSLPELEKYQVLIFSDRVSYLLGNDGRWLDYDPKTSADQVYRALAAVKPDGTTNMHEAFETAFRFRPSGLDTIYVLSDGLPNTGPGLTPEQANNLREIERSEILSRYIRYQLRHEWNRPLAGRPRVRIHTIGFFFESPDVGAFLWALARENDGSFVGMSKP